MGWVSIKDFTTGADLLPKDAILLPPGMEPPPNYKYCYTTRIANYSFIASTEGDDLLAGDGNREPLECEREVWIPIE